MTCKQPGCYGYAKDEFCVLHKLERAEARVTELEHKLADLERTAACAEDMRDASEIDGARLDGSSRIRAFILAGNATFTLVSKKTGTRFTYRVRAGEIREGATLPDVWFVSLLVGSDNEGDYAFLGSIFARDGVYRPGKKSKVSPDAPGAKAFAWFWSRLALREPETVEFWHAGRCGRCARRLTVPESIAIGLGPECAQKGF